MTWALTHLRNAYSLAVTVMQCIPRMFLLTGEACLASVSLSTLPMQTLAWL